MKIVALIIAAYAVLWIGRWLYLWITTDADPDEQLPWKDDFEPPEVRIWAAYDQMEADDEARNGGLHE